MFIQDRIDKKGGKTLKRNKNSHGKKKKKNIKFILNKHLYTKKIYLNNYVLSVSNYTALYLAVSFKRKQCIRLQKKKTVFPVYQYLV